MSSFLDETREVKDNAKVGNFNKFVFPHLGRIYPSLVQNDFIKVQPMTPRRPVVRVHCYDPEDHPEFSKEEDPAGYSPLVFFTKYRYGTKKSK